MQEDHVTICVVFISSQNALYVPLFWKCHWHVIQDQFSIQNAYVQFIFHFLITFQIYDSFVAACRTEKSSCSDFLQNVVMPTL